MIGLLLVIGAFVFVLGRAEYFDGERALEWVYKQEALGPRIPGSESHTNAQQLILTELKKNRWAAESIPCQTYNGLTAENVMGKMGDGEEWLIIGAHYDSRIRADQETDPVRKSEPVPGANDGASGVAVLLELARVLPIKFSNAEIWLVFFDLEDNGDIEPYNEWILGSSCFVEQLPDLYLERTPAAAIIVDMIGDSDLQIFYEANSTASIRKEIWDQANQLGYDQFIARQRYSIIDDHTPFLLAGIPAIDIIDFDYPYWHTLDDTSDKVSAQSLEAVGRTLQVWLLNK